MKPRVLFDARWILVENRFDGVSRYTYELAHALAKRDDIEVAWLIYDERQRVKLPPGDVVWANNPNDAFREFFTLARTVNASGYDLVYSPFFTVGTLGKRFKLILTIHDMIYFTHRTPPQWLPWHIRLGWWLFHLTYWPMRSQLNKADMVATVSETAREELLAARATKREIVTVANAVNPDFADDTIRDHSQMDGVVYMGAFTPYKNVECVIDAVALLPDVTLHLCGKLPPARRPDIEARIRDRGIEQRVVMYDGATDDQYKDALSQARCSISASRLEGFGLPVLEAQQRGVPFVCADTPIFHEVAGESVLYFDPNAPEEAAAHIRSLADKKTSDSYIARGYENVRRYTWEHSADVAADMCRSLSSV